MERCSVGAGGPMVYVKLVTVATSAEQAPSRPLNALTAK
jgi:hypothetical protein